MSKKRILFLAEELRIGGAESYFYSIENNVNRNKYDFYCMAVNGKQYDRLSSPSNYYEYSFSFIDRFKKAFAICETKNIEVIHCNSLRLAIIASAIKKRLNVKVIYTKHNLTFLEKISKRAYARLLNKHIDVVNVICNTEKNQLIKEGVEKQRIEVIYNGVRLEDYSFVENVSHNALRVGILARLSKEKNHGLFLDIAEILHQKVPNAVFMIGGDGPEKEKIAKEITRRGMTEYVEMCGYVKASDFLSQIDFSMLVSEREAFPISIIEAMSVGAIVVARDVGGIRELIDPNVGYLIEGNESVDYVNAVLDAIENKDRALMRIRARKKVEQLFTFDQMLYKIEQLYD